LPPDGQLLRTIADLRRRVADLEADRQRPYLELRGIGERRLRIGVQDDGGWGLRVWDSTGALVIDDTTA
jgi:hypothetical protein